MSCIYLEDFHEDILGKAMRGLGIGKNEMAKRWALKGLRLRQFYLGVLIMSLSNDGPTVASRCRKS